MQRTKLMGQYLYNKLICQKNCGNIVISIVFFFPAVILHWKRVNFLQNLFIKCIVT